ncbi:general transcription factor 3C polypeptide 1 [Betta splendens]|uniref:General transcription factor 3C polypeptide 1 n=1 Tax=Betta splendens TaxID=158456 RepID=A0A6P7MS13_BETSP|nr:general transcription factor 3C polypeptide 1 [Betta splendens]
MDPLSIVEDEVALEGLDGITIFSLWIRLENRKPKFPLKLDECTKEFVWKSLLSNAELTFFELPQEREDVVLFDRCKDVDPDTGVEKARPFSDADKDIYPVHIIVENKDGIQGSCALFTQRKDITKNVRSKSLTPLVTLDEAVKRYGRKLVAVASQTLRFRTLIGSESDPDLKLSDDSYCLLERVGRSRWEGELQRDLHGNSFKTDARKLHYMRKALVKHGLIRMQSHVTRLKSGNQQYSILLQLKRFHILRRSKYDILTERVSNILQQLPGQFATMVVLKNHLNLTECSFKRLLNYMRSSKLIQFVKYPLEDLDPAAGPCTTRTGNKVRVHCVKLLKPYARKGAGEDDDDDDDDDEENDTQGRTAFPTEGRIMEKDVLSQAYSLISSCGTKGIPQTGIGFRMNIGKLESRMICRTLERDGLIKGFLVDEGRQRTTKFISHKCVGVSDQFQLFAKEQERSKVLSSSAVQASDTPPATPKTPTTSGASAKTSARKKKSGKTPDCSESKADKTPDWMNVSSAEQAPVEEDETRNPAPATPEPQSEVPNADVNSGDTVVVRDVDELKISSITISKKSLEKTHETYRLLKRKNLIIEAIQNLKIIEGLFQLQKMINDEERQSGLSSKCCRKTILRLVNSLRREGLLKIFTTTVIVDGITKKVEMVAHPSIQHTDDIVNRVIDQVRFRISSSDSAIRMQTQEKEKEQKQASDENTSSSSKSMGNQAVKKSAGVKKYEKFQPTTVKGLGKTWGFQPKMYRMRVVHAFLYYLIYDHPLRDKSTGLASTGSTTENLHSSNPDAKHPDTAEIEKSSNLDGKHPDTTEKEKSSNLDGKHLDTTEKEKSSNPDAKHPDTAEEQNLNNTQPSKNAASVEPETAHASSRDVASGDEEVEQTKKVTPENQSDLKVYADEDSWKRFIPPVHVHRDYGSGWAMVGDILLCLPLSIFIQVIQINYEVEGLEDYLKDPVKQHYLVSALPPKMRRQLLFKRKYIFSFHETLQKLVYMGLLQFGPVEKFQDKDLVFLFLKRKATIVDTTNAEPHYWLVTELPDKPFERRRYLFNSTDDVENYWFDLMCVCLNTPLGVIRGKRNATEVEAAPSFVRERNVFVGLAYMLRGNSEVCDDGLIPGDGKGAGGLHSEFFAHLKRNWYWTNHLLAHKKPPSGSEAPESKVRLRSLLTKNALRIALTAGGTTSPRCVTTKQSVMPQNVEVGVESASRNEQVVGGKRQKRKRSKKEVVKVQRKKKKKEPKKRTPAHDEADHKALKMMTRHRVCWSVQEDSLMMLCCVASDLFNSKLERPFVPWCVVRDLLHAEFDISADKTSLAVGRRSRHILKNPQTRLNYRICLAEVYQDELLMKELEQKKPADPNKPEDCAAAFSEYARLLRLKFRSAMSVHDWIIPDTKEELFTRFMVSTIESGKCISCKDVLSCKEDIHAIVLHNLIQSTLAMTNNQMKSSRSFQTFLTYSKYNQEMLCQVFLQCKKRGLVNRRRVGQQFGPKKNRSLPILPMSYQLSHSYYRCFSWRFPYTLCTDSFHFLRSLINNGIRDDRPFTSFYHETEYRTLRAEEEKKAEEIGEKQDGGEPEKTNTKLTNEGGNELMGVGGKTSEEQTNSGETLTDGGPGAEAPTSGTSPPTPQAPPDVTDMLQFSINSAGGACVVSLSLMTLGLLSVSVSIPKQMVVVDSSLVDKDVVKSLVTLEEDDDDDDEGGDCDGRKKLEVKAHQASHTKYLMMRGHCCPGIVKLRNLNTNDNIVVESCVMRLQLRNTPAHSLFCSDSFVPLDLTKCGPSLLPSVLTYSLGNFSSPPNVEELETRLIQGRGYTPQDIEACARLRRSLDEAGVNGLDINHLYEAHARVEEPQSGCSRSLQQCVKDLQEEGQIIKVGSLGERWVLVQHAEPWLLTINSKQRPQSLSKSDGLSLLKSRHNIPFMRKRCKRDSPEQTEEPAAKRLAVDPEMDDRETGDTGDTAETTAGEEQQREQTAEGGGDAQVDVEMDRTMQTEPSEIEEKAGEEEKVENKASREEKMQLRSRKGAINEGSEKPEPPLTGSDDQDDEEQVSFISRPWRLVDGKVNRPVCKGMLEAVLYHIMSRPGLTQQTLMQHYTDVLQPVALLELVQALLDLGCVTKRTLRKSPKASLFSCSVNQTSGTGAQMEEPDAVFYEPTVSCCLRLSQLLPNERHWNQCEP